MNPPLRVLHVVGPMDRAGVETWLMNVLRRLDPAEARFDFLTTSERPAAYDDELQALGARLLHCPRPDRVLAFSRRFLALLREHGPYDVVHSHIHHYGGLVMLLARLAGVPVRVVQSHTDTRSADEAAGPRRRAYLALMTALLRANATDLLAVGEEAGLALFGNDPRVRVIHLGVDTARFDPPADAREVRAELGLPPDALVFGHVGRFDPLKNHGFLLDIFRAALRLRPEAHLLLVGEGPLRPHYETVVRAHGLEDRVVFTGSRPDVPRLLAAMDVFVFPSLHEGLGLALVEAQLAGRPVIVGEHLTDEARLPDTSWHSLFLSAGTEAWARTAIGAALRGPAFPGEHDFDLARSTRRFLEVYERRRPH